MHFLAVKRLSTLLQRITSKHVGDFYSLNCVHSFRTKNKLKSHENVGKNNDFCGIVIPFEKDNILKFSQYMKSDKNAIISYVDFETLIKKIDGCANNLEKSSAKKLGEHITCGYSMSTVWLFDNIENKDSRGENFMKRFCSFLREHATNVIKLEKKKMLLLTKKELKLNQDATECNICVNRFPKKFAKDKNYRKVRDHFHFTGKHRGVTHSTCDL